MTKKIILPIIIIIVLVVIIYQVAFKKEELEFTLVDVVRGTVSQEVSETGKVVVGEEINLSFNVSGRIEKIYVKVGEEVNSGKALAKLDTSQLSIQLQEAQAALGVAQSKLDKLLAGASQEEIKVAQTKVDNAQISLDTKKQALDDAYDDALNTLEDAYLKAYNSQNTVDSIQRTYFTKSDQESIKVKENKNKIEEAVSEIKSSLEGAKADSSQENINSALSEIKDALSKISNTLKVIRETCEESIYRDTISSSDKSGLDTERTNINTEITDITDDQQSISSAQFAVDSAEGNLQTAKDELALLEAPPRQEDIDLYQAQVDQVQAQVWLLEDKLQEAVLTSPTDGKITKIEKRVGEIVQSALAGSVISFLPANPFQIEVDIYEEDIVKIKIGNPVDISLVAFPEKTFQGKVVAIDPAEKLIEGVVYYETTIDFDNIPEALKPGMTADLVIKTLSKEDVLIIPEDAIKKKDGKIIVEVYENEEAKEREIEIGLQGKDDLVEVIVGLREGEKIILE